jgi:hypothetical protein
MDNPEKLPTRRRKTNNIICVGHYYAQTNTHNVNKTWSLQQATGDKDEQEHNVNKTWAHLQTTGGKDHRTSFLCGNSK